MTTSIIDIKESIVLDEGGSLTLSEFCRACNIHAEYVTELINEGILDAQTGKLTEWRFTGICIRRTRTATRLQRDLRVNLPGAALVLELLEEIERLRRQ